MMKENHDKQKQNPFPLIWGIVVKYSPEIIIPLFLASTLLFLVNESYGFQRLYNYFNSTLCSHIDAHQTTYIGLSAYLFGLAYLFIRVLFRKNGKVITVRWASAALNSMFNATGFNIVGLTTILTFLYIHNGDYWYALIAFSFLGSIWIIIQVLREAFQDQKAASRISNLRPRDKTIIFASLVFMFTMCFIMIVNEAARISAKGEINC